MNEEKTCENCRYFIQHYAKGNTKRTLMLKVGCGHCYNGKGVYDKRRGYLDKKVCELWEPVETLIAERKENILTVLRGMAEDLKNIAFILKDDENV